MRATIKIQMDNAAFDDTPEIELASILETLARRFRQYGLNHGDLGLRDFNGNKVGSYVISGRR